MDAPIPDEYRKTMNDLAKFIDHIFNGDTEPKDRKNAFVLLVAPFGDEPEVVNYISNADRGDVITLLKRYLAHHEGIKE